MFISIGLTVHNRKKLTEYCINSIHDNTPKGEYELIVVDNDSDIDIIDMLMKYRMEHYIDKLSFRNINNLGSAINLAWEKADSTAEWLLVLDNDNFCMKGWLNNFKTVVYDLNPDFVFTQIRMPGFHRGITRITRNGGSCFEFPPTKIPYGAGLAIKKSIVDKYGIRFPEGNELWSIGKRQGSIYSVIGMILTGLKLNYVELGKPCILAQDCEYSNPEYFDYYSKVFGFSGRQGTGRYGIGKTEMSKFRSLRIRGGNTRYPDEYYKGSGYKIGKHYRAALKSEIGRVLWDEPMYDAPKNFFKK